MYHRFYFVGREIIYHLIRIYLSSSYGIELWYNDINRNRAFHKVSVGYHKTGKRIAGLCTWDSNHSTSESVGVNKAFRYVEKKRLTIVNLFFYHQTRRFVLIQYENNTLDE